MVSLCQRVSYESKEGLFKTINNYKRYVSQIIVILILLDYPHKGKIDGAILSLQEKGELEKMKKKWWEDEDNEEHCEVW